MSASVEGRNGSVDDATTTAEERRRSSSAVGQAAATTTPSINTGLVNSNVANKAEQISPTTTTTIITTTATTTTTAATTATITTTPTPTVLQYLVNFHEICSVTALLPLFTMLGCFVTAYVFQYDDVHETHCRVYNVIPSISAITGVSPQTYFWRFSIALHIGPRLPIAFVYRNYYRSLLQRLGERLAAVTRQRISFLIELALVLNLVEVLSLGGVTYVSNRENYPVHERIFIIFMVCSLCHMLATIKLQDVLLEDPEQLPPAQRRSIKFKKNMFAISIISTVGLLYFFAKHRLYCHDLAFTWFAFFEYVIAIANLLFHFTIVWDFPSQYLMIVQGTQSTIEQLLSSPADAAADASAKKLN